MGFELAKDYKDVTARIQDFREKYPEGCLRPADLTNPYQVLKIDGKDFVVYVAAAYRTADDPTPGIGTAWEPVPGKTPYTKDSELMNAETSAWGRAIIAVGASDAKHIATVEDVRNRTTTESKPTGKKSSSPSEAATVIDSKKGVDMTKALASLESSQRPEILKFLMDKHVQPNAVPVDLSGTVGDMIAKLKAAS